MSLLSNLFGPLSDWPAEMREGRQPIGVLDIGSNSIRLVVYERHARWLTPQYNEKSAAGLGRGLAATGRLSDEAVDKGLRAIRRFALMARLMHVGEVHVLATSAVREAENGPAFTREVEAVMQAPVRILSGSEEAHFAALGVVAGIPEFDGVVGDLGGGSLELAALCNRCDSVGETHELGALRIEDDAGGDPEKAAEIAIERLTRSELLHQEHTTFAAIGGTWRSIAKLHQARTDYPLHMIQHYGVPAKELIDLCEALVAAASKGDTLDGMKVVSSGRKPLLPYGAAVLGAVLKAGRYDRVVFSALGVREGYLYGLLPPDAQDEDPLLQAASEMSLLMSRAPAHANDLTAFSERFFEAIGVGELPEQARLRHAACLLSDIGWRGHPDYRGEQSVDLIAYGAMTGIDHPGRAFLAEVLAVRYMGLKQKSVSSALLGLSGSEGSERARMLGALFRVAYPLSAGMPGVLERFSFARSGQTLVLDVPADLEFLAGERVQNRLNNLANVSGFERADIRTV